MRTMSHSRWLIITSCLVVSACTEKTIINEAPKSTVGDASATHETTVPQEADTPTTPSAGIAGAPVDNTPVPNMVGGPTDPATQLPVDPGVQTPVNSEPASAQSPGGGGQLFDPSTTPVVGGGLLSDPVTTPAATPAAATPAAATPAAATPAAATPAAATPAAATPAVATPAVATPAVATPAVATPAVATPAVATPAVATPAVATPAVATPAVATPAVATPAVATPAVATPAVATPAVATPTVISGNEAVTTGTPGMSVDCQLALPCRWISDDTQFAVTITNADNIGKQGRLSIEYSVLTSHDTEILIASTEPAIDNTGIYYEPTALRFGEGVGGRAQGVLAGAPVTATIEFDKPGTTASIDMWSIGLSDSGLVRQPVFSGIPVGSVTTQHADCANTLPCAWQSPAKDVTITLLSANGFGSTSRLSTNFKVETTRNAVVAVDAGASATGTDGLRYKGRTHAIGLETGAEKLTGNTIPGAQLAGTVYFSRTQSMSPALQNLSLVVYEDKPVPRWNPSFLSVPVQ